MRKVFLLLIPILMIFTACDKPNASIAASNNSSSALKTFLQSSTKPVVLKFYASWCGSCRQYAAAYEEVKKSMSETVDFREINVSASANKALVKELRVSRIPETIFVSKDRANITRKLGPLSVKELSSDINKLKSL